MSQDKPQIQSMAGQWFGRSQPNDSPWSTLVTINIEPRSPNNALLTGVEPQTKIRTIGDGTIEIKGNKLLGKTFNYRIYDFNTHTMVPIFVYYKNAGIKENPASEAEYIAEFDGTKLAGTFKNNAEKAGTFEVWRSFSEAMLGQKAPRPNEIKPISWKEFKKHVEAFKSKGRVLFRGQQYNIYPLKTSLHRKERNNIPQYFNEDVSRLRHQINAISQYYYQQTAEDLQGLLNLAQHHGFPTPLLDWTESPYVAAFFAFDCLTERGAWLGKKNREPVRIFTFDLDSWRRVPRIWAQSLLDPCPDFQFFHPPAHNNPRYYPQQSMAAFSTVDDIEDFIAAYELQNRAKYLTRIDILASEREVVEDELRFMGITPATLFPGLEGACKSLRSELF
jgi:hypothetical protein